MKRVVFLPDRPVDRAGDLFRDLTASLGIVSFGIDTDPAAADVIAFVGRERASAHFGRRVKTGPQQERWHDHPVYVLPSTAPEHRGRFFEGVWRSFAAHVLGRDLAVRDEFKGMTPEAIRALLAARRFPFAVCCANVAYDINLGSIIRSANAFLAREIVIFGRKKTDLRGAMGSYIYETITHVPDIAAFAAHAEAGAYTPVAFEETASAVPLASFVWPDRPLMLFGQEGPGLPPELLARAAHKVVIPQYGSIRSLNVGVVAGIAMYDWHAKRTNG